MGTIVEWGDWYRQQPEQRRQREWKQRAAQSFTQGARAAHGLVKGRACQEVVAYTGQSQPWQLADAEGDTWHAWTCQRTTVRGLTSHSLAPQGSEWRFASSHGRQRWERLGFTPGRWRRCRIELWRRSRTCSWPESAWDAGGRSCSPPRFASPRRTEGRGSLG